MNKNLAVILTISLMLLAAGCGNKNAAVVNQNVKTLADGFQQSMVTYFDIKNLQDNSFLLNQMNDNLKKVENSKKKLEQLSGLNENVGNEKLKAEVATFINLGREREQLVIKYLDDIRRDLDLKYKNPDAQVNINKYIANVPNKLLDLEYQSEQSTQRLMKLTAK